MIVLNRYDDLADVDMYGSFDIPFPNFLDDDFSSYLPGDEYKGLSVCPPEGQTKGKKKILKKIIFSGHIFITADCWRAGGVYSNFSLYVSTKAANLFQHIPLTSMNKFRYASAVIDSGTFQTNERNSYVCRTY